MKGELPGCAPGLAVEAREGRVSKTPWFLACETGGMRPPWMAGERVAELPWGEARGACQQGPVGSRKSRGHLLEMAFEAQRLE